MVLKVGTVKEPEKHSVPSFYKFLAFFLPVGSFFIGPVWCPVVIEVFLFISLVVTL